MTEEALYSYGYELLAIEEKPEKIWDENKILFKILRKFIKNREVNALLLKDEKNLKKEEKNVEVVLEKIEFPTHLSEPYNILAVTENRVFVYSISLPELGMGEKSLTFKNSFFYDFQEKKKYYHKGPIDQESTIDWVYFDKKRDRVLVYLNSLMEDEKKEFLAFSKSYELK